MSESMKQYYLKNLEIFSKIYFCVESHQITGGNPSSVNYWNDDVLFDKIKIYAEQGKIISTIGDIGDLEFLKEEVSIVDTSNIQDYIVLNIRTTRGCSPRVIWSQYCSGVDPFYSYIQDELTLQEREEYASLLHERCSGDLSIAPSALYYLQDVASKFCEMPSLAVLRQTPQTYATPASYTQQSLNILRRTQGIFVDRMTVRAFFSDGLVA